MFDGFPAYIREVTLTSLSVVNFPVFLLYLSLFSVPNLHVASLVSPCWPHPQGSGQVIVIANDAFWLWHTPLQPLADVTTGFPWSISVLSPALVCSQVTIQVDADWFCFGGDRGD